MNRRDALATFVGFAVAAVVLGGLAYVVGVADVAAALGRARLSVVALVGVALVAWISAWGTSLRFVLAAVGVDVSAADAILVNASATFANNVTPFGQAGGEPVAAWLIADLTETEFDRSLAAMTSFDAINVVPSVSFAVVGLGYYATTTVLGDRLQVLTIGVLFLALGVPTAGLLTWRHRRTAEAWLARAVVVPLRTLGRLLPRVEPPDPATVRERVERFVGSIELIAGDRRRLAAALGFSTVGWALQATGLWLALTALGASVPPYVPLFVVPLGALASAMPTPGGLGGIEAVQVTLLAAATTAAPSTIAAAVAVFSVGGFFLSTSLGAAAAAVLQVRGRRTESF